ncbi:MAG TPA: carbon starvation protein A, partial [Pyrodictium sp.]|nr:carbon starvation protein A [Pyrodictium sp.]
AVHDYLALMASVRYGGISIVSVSENVMGKAARYLFLIYVLFALILVYAAFGSIAAKLFSLDPRIAMLSILFMPIALFLGFLMYRVRMDIKIASLIAGVLVVLAFIYSYNVGLALGPFDPSKSPAEGGWVAYHRWLLVLAVYAILAASLPVWYLLQPRDYANAYMLWLGLVFAVGGLFIVGFRVLEAPAYTSFAPNIIGGQPTPFWPAIPLIIACGSLSGFHSLVASGTTSKQLANELDALFVGYGGMLTEGALSSFAVIIPISLAWQAPELVEMGVFKDNILELGAIQRYTVGYGYVMGSALSALGVSFEAAYKAFTLFAALILSMYIMTTLDTSTRLARFAWQELFDWMEARNPAAYKIITNKWFASFIVVLAGTALAYPVLQIGAKWDAAYQVVWPAFAGTNQMLAAIALLTSALWVYLILGARGAYGTLIMVPALALWITVTAGLAWWLWKIAPVLPNIQKFGAGSMILFSLILSILLLVLFLIALVRGKVAVSQVSSS